MEVHGRTRRVRPERRCRLEKTAPESADKGASTPYTGLATLSASGSPPRVACKQAPAKAFPAPPPHPAVRRSPPDRSRATGSVAACSRGSSCPAACARAGYRVASARALRSAGRTLAAMRADVAYRSRGPCQVARTNARPAPFRLRRPQDRKSTRLNSSHPSISYAVFCLKKKKKKKKTKNKKT